MALTIKSEEIVPSAVIRPLSDAEIDHVNGGAIHLLGAATGALLGAAVLVVLYKVLVD